MFDGDIVTVEEDRYGYGEQRFVTFGLLPGRVILNPLSNAQKTGFSEKPVFYSCTHAKRRINNQFLITGFSMIAVVHREREDCTRIISARKATKYEQRTYFEQLSN